MASMSAEARAEYLKRYLDPPKEKKKKRTKDAKNFRIIEEDTFLPIKEENSAKKRKVTDSEDEEDALLRAARKARELEATKFKAGTFISVDEDDAQSSNVKTAQLNRSQPVPRTGRTDERRGEDSDASPPRRRADKAKDSDASSPRPSRPTGRRADHSDASPPCRRSGKGSDSDASPPRQRNAGGHKRRGSDSDASPPRRHDQKDRSLARRRVKREAPDSDQDHSPPRRGAPRCGSRSPDHRRPSPPTRLASVKIERRSDSDKSPVASSDDDEEGRFAAPRKRVTLFNRRKRNGKEPEDPEKKARESAKQKEWDAKYAQWSKGVEQAKEREAKLKEMAEVAQESFTRYADDEAMNVYLKEQIHDLDPMANFYRTKQQKIEMKTGVVYPKYTGHWPPNRFGIAPGYRWDGVDRSNGFEAKMAGADNQRKAEESIAYRSIIECEE